MKRFRKRGIATLLDRDHEILGTVLILPHKISPAPETSGEFRFEAIGMREETGMVQGRTKQLVLKWAPETAQIESYVP